MSENRIRKTSTVQPHGPASAGIWSTLTGFLMFNPAGTPKTMVDTDTTQSLSNKTILPKAGAAITANGAVPVPTQDTLHYVTKAGVAAMTLAAPTVGVEIEIKSASKYAHTLTATGILDTGTSAVDTATFAAELGAGLKLRGYGTHWQVVYSVGITFS